MATLLLKNVPDELVKRLELAASARQHAIDDEVIDRLDDSFGTHEVAQEKTYAELVELAKKLRGEGTADWFTPEFIRMARELGRE